MKKILLIFLLISSVCHADTNPYVVGAERRPAGMPTLNKNHPLYGNITAFYEGVSAGLNDHPYNRFDDVLNQIPVVIPGYQHIDHKDVLDETVVGTDVQGVAVDDEYLYVFNTTSLKKYKFDGTEVASNTNPWTDVNQDHIGDGFVCGDYLYAPLSKSADPQYNRVVKYNKSDLTYVSDNTPSWMGNMSVNEDCTVRYGIAYITDATGTNEIRRFQLSDETPLSNITLSTYVRRAQGVTREDADGNFWVTSYNYDTGGGGSGLNEIHKFGLDGTFLGKFVPWLYADGTAEEIEGLDYKAGELFITVLNEGVIYIDTYDSSIRMNNNPTIGNGDGITLVSDSPSFPDEGTVVIVANSWDGGVVGNVQQVFTADTTDDASRKWLLQFQPVDAVVWRVYPTGFHYGQPLTGGAVTDHRFICTWKKVPTDQVETTFYSNGYAIGGVLTNPWVNPDAGGLILGRRNGMEPNYRFGVKRAYVLDIALTSPEVEDLEDDFDSILNVKSIDVVRPAGTDDRVYTFGMGVLQFINCGAKAWQDKCITSAIPNSRIKFHALPGPDKTFYGWTQDLLGNSENPITIKIDAAKSIRAAFTATVEDKYLMPLGDSITRGSGDSPIYDMGYRDHLADDLGISAYDFVGPYTDPDTDPTYDVDHAGVSGERTDEMEGRLQEHLNLYMSNVNGTNSKILIHAGTNDIAQGTKTPAELDAYVQNIKDMIDMIHLFDPRIDVFVASIIPWVDGETAVPAFNIKLETMLSGHSKTNLYNVDIYQDFIDYPSWETTLMSDNVHPNDLGYQEMAASWYAAIVAAP